VIDTKKAKRLITYWRRILGIDANWEIALRVNDSWQEDDSHRDAAGHISVEEGYFRAYLTINGFNFPPDKLEEVIVHELCHIVLSPIATLAQSALGEAQEVVAVNIVEATTERFSRALRRLKSKR